MKTIPFNKIYISGKEIEYIHNTLKLGKISGDGTFTKRCSEFFAKKYNFQKSLLTTSCTDALEMAAILIDIKPGDEIIVPSYTYASSANAFTIKGANIVFADSRADHPGIDEKRIENFITAKTKAIVPVHYAGVACNMDIINDIAQKHNLSVIEDAAQAIDSYFINRESIKKPLGSLGDLSAFSFHETKNIISGEGGMLVINNEKYNLRAEIIRENGTNRSAFFRGEIDKYGWVDIGSSFLPSDIIAAFLFAQLENIDAIQQKRLSIWKQYFDLLSPLQIEGKLRLPFIPVFATNNAHMFYVICTNLQERTDLINHLKKANINAVFHYQSLHKSVFYNNSKNKQEIGNLPLSDFYTDTLLRLPFYFELQQNDIEYICSVITKFYEG